MAIAETIETLNKPDLWVMSKINTVTIGSGKSYEDSSKAKPVEESKPTVSEPENLNEAL